MPPNTIKSCVDIVHFSITMEFWNRTPANRGTQCAPNKHVCTHLDKQPEERGCCKYQGLQMGSYHKPKKKPSHTPLRPQPFHSLRDNNPISEVIFKYSRLTMNTFLLDSKHLHTGFSAGTCSVQMTALLHFISPPQRKAKRQGYYL